MSAQAATLAAAGEPSPLAARLAALDWPALGQQLDDFGYACVPDLLSPPQCATVREWYDDEALFRSRVVMQRHGFGRGEYQYFDYPLPRLVAQLRQACYPPLAAIAQRWNQALGVAEEYPAQHDDFIARCHRAGQRRPTPLLLRYGAGDYNCLHQDLYGEQVFPLQMTILLSQPGVDFQGGEFVLTEQRPRRQSRVEVVPLDQGDAVIFAVRQRPQQGAQGVYRVQLRHGVSRLRAGHRHALGVIFHDAT
jgi:hypothetical protein